MKFVYLKKKGKLTIEDLKNEKILDVLSGLSADCISALEGFESKSIDETKSAIDVLLETLTEWKSKNVNKANDSKNNQKIQSLLTSGNLVKSKLKRPGPNEEKLKEILERTQYSHEISSGQRKYGGPPPGWKSENPEVDTTQTTVAPPNGCECFVGKLPKDLFEDELIPVFEKHGKIWDLRLMIDPSTGLSKGYCFVTYCEKPMAQKAANEV